MNAQSLARSAYSSAVASTRTGRATEYDLLARVTGRLKAASREDADFSSLVRALHDNRILWNALGADVAIDTNPLPSELRARIFYLAQFTAHHTGRVLAGEAGIDVLIEINTAVMRGLGRDGDRA